MEESRTSHQYDIDQRSTGLADREPACPSIDIDRIGTAIDQQEMQTLGRVQELRRNFKYLSVVAFGCTLIGTWQFTLGLIQFGLTDGGTAGMIYGYLVVFAGFLCVYMSIAEMASMAPSSGGQYHWVSEFAPAKVQKYLSYLSGWLVFSGWQAALVASCYLAGTIIQGMLVLNYPRSYTFQRWQGTLLIIAAACFSVFFNTFLAKKLAFIEGILLIVYVIGFFAILIPLWVLAPRADVHVVFTSFNNGGGWSSIVTAVFVGMSGILPAFGGYDCIVHLGTSPILIIAGLWLMTEAEEINDASRTLPLAIMSGVTINGIMGLVMIITVCFSLEHNVKSILETKTGFPFIQLFYEVTQSYSATNAMTAIVLIVFVSTIISTIATASRQLWAFSRDGGFPFATFIAKVHKGKSVPLNAVVISLTIIILLSLINIGSSVALNAVVSLGNSSILSSYILTIACLLSKRLRREPLPISRFSLGRFGIIINIGGLVVLCPLFVFVLFPLATPVAGSSTMNFGCVLFSGVIIISTVYYIIGGRSRYTPPVAIVRRRKEGYEVRS